MLQAGIQHCTVAWLKLVFGMIRYGLWAGVDGFLCLRFVPEIRWRFLWDFMVFIWIKQKQKQYEIRTKTKRDKGENGCWIDVRWWKMDRWCWIDADWLSQSVGLIDSLNLESHWLMNHTTTYAKRINRTQEFTQSILKTDFYSKTLFDKNKVNWFIS